MVFKLCKWIYDLGYQKGREDYARELQQQAELHKMLGKLKDGEN